MEVQKIDLKSLKDAVKTLKEALHPKSQLERDGTIQRFEYTFELSWKFIRRFLIALGRTEVSGSPKPLIRDANQEGWITDVEAWFGFLEFRNRTTHIYDAKVAEEIFNVAIRFPPYVEELVKALEKIAKS